MIHVNFRYVEPCKYVELAGPLYERSCTVKSALTPGGGRVYMQLFERQGTV